VTFPDLNLANLKMPAHFLGFSKVSDDVAQQATVFEPAQINFQVFLEPLLFQNKFNQLIAILSKYL
jgi:hypothetical protein